MKTILALMLVASCAFADTSDLEYQMRYNNDLLRDQNKMMEQRMWQQQAHELEVSRQMEKANEQAMWDNASRNRQTVWPKPKQQQQQGVSYEQFMALMCRDIDTFKAVCEGRKEQ